MVFDFDIKYVKVNTFPYVDVLSLYWIETDVLPQKHYVIKIIYETNLERGWEKETKKLMKQHIEDIQDQWGT